MAGSTSCSNGRRMTTVNMNSRWDEPNISFNAPSLVTDDHVVIPNDVILVEPGRLPDLSDIPRLGRVALEIASRIEWGSLLTILPDGRALRFQGKVPGHEGVMKINDFKFANKLLSSGTSGFAEAYFARHWESPNLGVFLEVIAKNADRVERYFSSSPIIAAIQRFLHFLNRNTKQGAKRNIMAHYDLGNAFYTEWLDPTMTYSSAKFSSPDDKLSDAQLNKYRSLAEQIDLQPEHTVLEIGSGWGGFAEYAASEIGCAVTGITISPEQLSFAQERIQNQGLEDKVEFRLQDYRDVRGTFDRVASIEMFEAVGLRYWPVYFQKIYESLNPGGKAGLQTITIREKDFEHYRRNADFIQRHIFPGGMLPSPNILRNQVETAGLSWVNNINFGTDYAKTLNQWRHRFQEAWPKIEKLGFDERFRLLWKYYLSYCEAGFRAGTIDVTQVALARP